MKVLAHIPPIEAALGRAVARCCAPVATCWPSSTTRGRCATWPNAWAARRASPTGTTDHDVFTRYDTLERARSYLPAGMRVVGVRGVRVVTPTSKLWSVPGLGRLIEGVERAACDLPGLRRLGGFMIVVARKD